MDAVIEELASAKEFPAGTVRHCLDHPDEVVPGFLDLLRQYAEHPHLMDSRADALFYIAHILGELGETRAFVPLLEFVSGNHDRVEEILGDAVTENLPRILIGAYDGEADRLYAAMNDPRVDELVRHAAFMTWTYAVTTGRIARDEAERYLAECFDSLRPQSDSYVWVAWADSISYLGFERLAPLVKRVLEMDRVPYRAIDLDDFETALADRLAAADPLVFLESQGICPFRDTIGALSSWHSFSPEYLRKAEQPFVPAELAVPAFNPYRGVGRNDPCPCGSGKKFKKCCLS